MAMKMKMKAAAKPMKMKMKAAKVASMKKMKAMKVSKRGSKIQVWNGTKVSTKSRLTKSDFIKSKSGKIVSKKKNAHGKRVYKRIQGWTQACTRARKALGIKGFQAIGGATPRGQQLLKQARSFYRR